MASRRSILIWAVPAALLLLVAGALSLRHVGEGTVGVLEPALSGGRTEPVQPGWHLAPRGLYRLHLYPQGAVRREFGRGDPLRFRSPEGAWMVAAGEMELRIPASSALELHKAAGGNLGGWLQSHLREVVYALLASPRFAPLTLDRLPEMEAEGARELGQALAPAGVEVAGLRLRTIGYEGGPLLEAGRRAGVARKLLWLAIDSFDWEIIDPLVEQGRMPNMARLKKEGSWGQLRAMAPLISPVLWTTIATGTRPGTHGIVDFIATDPATGNVLPVTSTLRRSSAFWNMLGDAGVSVGVVAWWASFPAEPVNGFMATDRIAFQLFREMFEDQSEDNPLKVYPARYWPEIAPHIEAPGEIGGERLARFFDSGRYEGRLSPDDVSRVNEFRTVLAATDTYMGIGRQLFREHPTDLRALYFEGPDTASHLFMPFRPPAIESADPVAAEAFSSVVDEYYVYQDEIIGMILDEFAGDGTTVIICSDHGFRTGAERPPTESRIGKGKASDWHDDDGVLLLWGEDIRPGQRILGATILDLVPTLLALYGLPVGEDMPGKVLTGAIREEFLQEHPVTTIPSWDEGRGRRRPQFAEVTREDQELMEKLASLGYIEQDAPSSRGNLAVVKLQEGETAEAVRIMEEALAEVDDPSGRLILARAYRMDGQPEKARAELEGLLKTGRSQPRVLLELAILSREARDFSRARSLLNEALQAGPDRPEILLQLALLDEQEGRLREALDSYRKVVELDPASSQALNQMGLILRKMGRPQEAIREFTRAIQADPDDHFAYNNLGLLYQRMGDTARAREMLETGIAMAPRSAILHNSLGSVLFQAGDTDGAIAAFRNALEIDPGYQEVLINLATLHRNRGETAQAGEYAERLLAMKDLKEDVRISLASLLASLNRAGEGMAILNGLLDREPESFKALVTLARIHLGRGEDARAIPLLERAGRVQGGIPQLWNDLAGACARLGRSEEAREALRRSLQLDPSQSEIASRLKELGG